MKAPSPGNGAKMRRAMRRARKSVQWRIAAGLPGKAHKKSSIGGSHTSRSMMATRYERFGISRLTAGAAQTHSAKVRKINRQVKRFEQVALREIKS
ncbi:hypothetical protein ACFSKM_16515 [Ancylobacter dichloromethanicus]